MFPVERNSIVMIRVAHIVGSMSPSGIGNFLMNVYRNIDREQIQFDFIVHEHRAVSFDDEIIQLGGRLHYVTLKSESVWKNFNEIRKIVKREKYDMVFRHADNSIVSLDLLACKLGGAKWRIPHSHSTSTGNIKLHKLLRPFLNLLSTHRFACSTEAGKWLYGKKKYHVVMNGIDIPTFAFSNENRKLIRKQMEWEDKFVIGHVGNFLKVKNHTFMLSLLAELKKCIPNVKLVFIGGGDLYNNIVQDIEDKHLGEYVDLPGVRNDTAAILSAMDLFMFPSLYEGMPIALVEAQTAGLSCVVSDVITDDVIFSESVHKLPLADMKQWIKTITSIYENVSSDNREMKKDIVANATKEKGFCVKALGKYYDTFILRELENRQ